MAAGPAAAGAAATVSKPQAVPGASPDTTCAAITSDGTATANEVAKFTAACAIEPSAIFESGGNVGIGTTAPTATLDVNGNAVVIGSISASGAATLAGVSLPALETATASAGGISNSLQMIASSYKSTTAAAIGERFTWQAEPVGNDTASPSGSLNLLFNTDKKTPVETGLSLASNGQITFATGQTFPGTGTITGVTAGSGLTGGGTAGTVTVGLTNTCTSGQVLEWIGSAWACAGVGTGTITGVTAGTDLTGGGASGNVTLNLNTSKTDARYAQLAASNSFSGVQSITGSSSAQTLTVTQTGTGATGDGIHGITSATGGTGVFGEGAIGIQGYANTGGLAGLFRGATEVTGNGNNTVIGDPGCGSGYAGIGFIATTLAGCTNYALTGGAAGDTYVNSSGNASIHFRNTNTELATIDNLGNVNVIGQSSGGNLTVAGALTAGGGTPGSTSLYAVGVYGSLSGPSGMNSGVGEAGVWGDTGGASSAGVQGTADEGSGGVFLNNSNNWQALVAVNYYGGDSAVFQALGPGAVSCTIFANGNLTCNGTISGVVPAGAQKVSVYAMQSTENWFEDTGSGKLSSGSARIVLDPTFAQTVNSSVEYHVFLTPRGDCEGLYVGNQTAQGFEVHELRGGISNIAFDYRIMAKRNGFETVRLADMTEKYQEVERQQKELHERTAQRSAVSPKSQH